MGMTVGGFLWKVLKKWHESTMFLRECTFFWQNMDMRAVCFLENGRFLTKYGHESSNFFVKSRKIRASYWLFWPIKECSFDRIDVFLTDHVNERRGFFMKILKKMAREHCVFTEWTVFDKICGLELRVFTEWTVFWQNMGMRASIFSWKIRKKGHHIDSFGP